MAEEGFPVHPVASYLWKAGSGALRDPENPHGKEMLRPDGRAPSPGQIMTNPNLARTLRALSEGGKAAFYTGRIAESVARCERISTDVNHNLQGWEMELSFFWMRNSGT